MEHEVSDAARESLDVLRHSDLAGGELESSLRTVADAITAVFGADGGGIMLMDDQQVLHYVGATSGRSAALEAAQEETGEGPCVDSLVSGHPVQTEDLASDDRWPQLRSQVAELGIRAVLGVPLRLGLSTVGSLNVYRCRPHEWSEADVAAAETHARVIEELLAAAMSAQRRHTIIGQLQTALENRVVIERAVGIVMATRGLDPAKAFNELRLHARGDRIRVSELADRVVESRCFPPLDDESSEDG